MPFSKCPDGFVSRMADVQLALQPRLIQCMSDIGREAAEDGSASVFFDAVVKRLQDRQTEIVDVFQADEIDDDATRFAREQQRVEVLGHRLNVLFVERFDRQANDRDVPDLLHVKVANGIGEHNKLSF